VNHLELRFELPDWMQHLIGKDKIVCPSLEDRMRFAIRLSWENVEQQTGGPFGAAVFDSDGVLVAPGINIVTASNCSVLHAEIVALMLAQKVLGRYDIGNASRGRYDLVATTQPCAMCFGAIPWSGVSRLVCGGRDEDARRIGFDEGPKPENWIAGLESRGIAVVQDVLRKEAVDVLQRYAQLGRPIYNATRRNTPTDR